MSHTNYDSFSLNELWTSSVVEYIKKRVPKYLSRIGKDIEIEGRLGVRTPDGFEPDLGQRYFDKLYKIYIEQMKWRNEDNEEYIPREVTEVVVFYPNEYRIILRRGPDGDYKLVEAKKKDRIDNITAFYVNKKIYVRFSTSTEEPIPKSEEVYYTDLSKSILFRQDPDTFLAPKNPVEVTVEPLKYRIRKRTSFYYNMIRIDCTRTKIHTDYSKLNELSWKYEVECELYKSNEDSDLMIQQLVQGFFERVLLEPKSKISPINENERIFSYFSKGEGQLICTAGYSNDLKPYLLEHNVVPSKILSKIQLLCIAKSTDERNRPLFRFISLPCIVPIEQDQVLHISFGQYEFEMRHNNFSCYPLDEISSLQEIHTLKRPENSEENIKKQSFE